MAIADRLRVVRFEVGGQITPLLDIADGSVYTTVRDSLHFTPPTAQPVQSKNPRRYGGARTIAEQHNNGSVEFQALVRGASNDIAVSNLSRLVAMIEAPQRGMFLEWRPTGTTRSVYFEMRGTGDWEMDYSWLETSAISVLKSNLKIELAPTAYGAPYDIRDRFDTDTITAGDWTVDTGAGSVSTPGNGQLVPSTTALKCVRYTGRGYPYGDVRSAILWFTGASVASSSAIAALCMDVAGADTMLGARIVGTTNQLQIVKVVAGVVTVLANTAMTPAVNTGYYVNVRRQGHLLIATGRAATAGSTPPWAPTEDNLYQSEGTAGVTSVTYRLTLAEEQQFTLGHAGIRWTPVDTTERILSFTALPFTYQAVAAVPNMNMYGVIYGDAPAEADTWFAGTPAVAIPFGLMSYTQDVDEWNRVPIGDVDAFTTFSPNWSTATLAGFINSGATATAVSGDAKFGGASVEIVTTAATVAEGIWFSLTGRFLRGNTYTAWCWVRLVSGATPTCGMRLGSGAGDQVISSTFTPTSTWQLMSVQWTPAADSWVAFLAITCPVAVASVMTMRADGISCVGTHRAALSGAMTNVQTTLPITKVPLDWPGPLDTGWVDVLIAPGSSANEIVRCNTATIDRDIAVSLPCQRGQDGSVAQVHSSGDALVAMPWTFQNRHGRGSNAPFGAQAAASSDLVVSRSGFAIAAVADTLSGSAMQATAAPGALHTLQFLFDPSVYVSDDFSDSIELEFWSRWHFSSTQSVGGLGPQISLSAGFSSVTSPASQRYAREFGQIGTTVRNLPPSGSNIGKLVKLGTLTLPVKPAYWGVVVWVQWGSGVSGTYDLDWFGAVPVRGRVVTPTARGTTQYPNLLPVLAGTHRIWRSDGGSMTMNNVWYEPSEDVGPGIPCELPTGIVDAWGLVSNEIPDNPTQNATAAAYSICSGLSVHTGVRPRYQWARGLTTSGKEM